MATSLLIYGVLGVLLVPSALCDDDLITVCIEDDEDLRVDCLIDPKGSQYNSYEFSWSTGSKETLINTNISGSAADPQFKELSYVEELEPHGYRMRLSGYIDKLPFNTTYICKIPKAKPASIYIEREQLVPCSAVSMFLKTSCSWIACLLLSFCHTYS